MTQLEEETPQLEAAFTLNGDAQVTSVRVDETLLEALRERAGITSVRGTCGIGVCGTCTVLLDGRPVSSCITLAAQVNGRQVTTAEGLAGADNQLSPVQEAFVRRGAYQCSFCIPAMTLAVHAALNDPEAGRDVGTVREYLAGNLCRCGTYPQILQAVTDLVSSAPDHDKDGENTR
ncbi:MAG TPA: (2Fe-2S)-binding protein [Nocardioidaceae bacterium]|nr:(2Fe-2S)-binding protein [Nocardioidaceae bacterium]